MRLNALSLQAFAAGLLFAGAAGAQNTFYVPDNNPGTGILNRIPFGDTDPTDPVWSNQKYQTLLTAAQLGSAPRAIVELGFASSVNGVRQFATIKVQMALTAATVLDPDFATNLGAAPTTVLNATNYQWSNRAYAWNRLGLTAPFQFDGASNVVVDIEVTGAGLPTASVVPAFLRENTVPRVFAFGYAGTPPATGTVDLNGLKIEVGASGLVDFAVFGAGCVGSNSLAPVLAYTTTANSGRIGQSHTVALSNANGLSPTGSLLFTGFTNRTAFGGALPLPFLLDPVGATGCNLYVDPLVIVFVGVNTSGVGSVAQAIPNDPTFVGARVYHQFLVIDSTANPLGVTFTNYGRVLIGS